MDTTMVWDWLLRGTSVGICAMLAAIWLLKDSRIESRFGALFLAGITCYILVSAPDDEQLFGPLSLVLHFIAIFNAVFFWWFVLALFSDQFTWKFYYWTPILILAATLPFRTWGESADQSWWVGATHQLLVIALLSHVLLLAMRDFSGDLVERRRRFRRAIALVIPLTGLCVVAVEIGIPGDVISRELLLFQAFAIGVITVLFAYWALQPVEELFSTSCNASIVDRQNINTDRPIDHLVRTTADSSRHSRSELATDASTSLAQADRIEILKLKELLDAGIYREAELTVGSLAEKLSIPEYRVRKHINEQLGYRNFSTFLNTYRIEAAKAVLSDPEAARKKIAQIAYDVGFNSIGPFNRAFRHTTGQTPTTFRQNALAETDKH